MECWAVLTADRPRNTALKFLDRLSPELFAFVSLKARVAEVDSQMAYCRKKYLFDLIKFFYGHNVHSLDMAKAVERGCHE